MPEGKMEKPHIVTCTAPVNIAVIKYCEYVLDFCLLCSSICGISDKLKMVPVFGDLK